MWDGGDGHYYAKVELHVPEATKAPATLIPAVATTAALAVIGKEEAAKVVTALTISVSEAPAADPMTVLPSAVKVPVTVTAAAAVSGPLALKAAFVVTAAFAMMAALLVIGEEVGSKVVTAYTDKVWALLVPRITSPWAVKLPSITTSDSKWAVALIAIESAAVRPKVLLPTTCRDAASVLPKVLLPETVKSSAVTLFKLLRPSTTSSAAVTSSK